ncbi:MAG: PAS domain-containing protein [Phycisphaerales bacterium]|nr:PAS domain-containing protein [Phycisphaerales bacterium]
MSGFGLEHAGLATSRQLAAAILDALPSPTVLVDHSGVITLMNRAWRERIETDGGDIKRCGIGANYFEECALAVRRGCSDARAFLDGCLRVARGERAIYSQEYECSRPGESGNWYSAEIRPLVVESMTGLLIKHADITRNKTLTRSLAQSTDWLDLALGAGEMVAWHWNLCTGRIHWSAPQVSGAGSGRDASEGTYSSFVGRMHPEDRSGLENALAIAKTGATTMRHELRVMGDSGETRWVRVVGRYEFADDGIPVQMLGIIHDITEQRIAFEQEATNRRRAAAAELSCAFAHEFNGLVLAAASVLYGIDGDAANMTPISRALDILQHAQNLSSSLMDAMSPGPVDVLETISIDSVVRRAIADLKALWPDGVILRAGEVDHSLKCHATPALLGQVLRLLVSNSVEATQGQGTIVIDAHAGVMSGTDRSACVVRVRDDGPGVPAQFVNRIFEPLFSTHRDKPGRGLGLSIAARIIGELGGTIEHVVAEPHGACFVIRLPNVSEAL